MFHCSHCKNEALLNLNILMDVTDYKVKPHERLFCEISIDPFQSWPMTLGEAQQKKMLVLFITCLQTGAEEFRVITSNTTESTNDSRD